MVVTKRGRPRGVRYGIRKNMMLDLETAQMLAELADGNEAHLIRSLIRAAHLKTFPPFEQRRKANENS